MSNKVLDQEQIINNKIETILKKAANIETSIVDLKLKHNELMMELGGARLELLILKENSKNYI